MQKLPFFVVLAISSACTLGADDGDNAKPTRRPDLYFPSNAAWESVPDTSSIDLAAVEAAIDFAMERKSSGVVILLNGRILAERHQPVEAPSLGYQRLTVGRTKVGHVIEDVASCQKSITSVLVGMAQQKELLKLDDPVHVHLGEGWSAASSDREAQITIRHLISMTSGLNERLQFVAPAGAKWAYNTNAYSRSLTAVARAAKLTPNELTRLWLTQPLGMVDSKWVERRLSGKANIAANRLGFATSARDLARFGLFMLAEGRWNNQPLLSDSEYLNASTSPSQELNPSYGYLWWLNGQEFVLRGNRRVKGSLIPTAPKSLFAAQGALGRKCYVVPTAQLVVVRLGDSPDQAGEKRFDEEFWRLLRKAAPRQ